MATPAGRPASRQEARDETSAAAGILSGAGWRVVTVDSGMPVETAWRRLAGAGLAAAPSAARDRPGAAV